MKLQTIKMRKRYTHWQLLPIICLILFLLTSCSIERKISKKYVGEDLSEVKKEFGTPQSTINLKNGQQLVVFERSKHLNAAKVNTQSFQYDEILSPAVEKKDRYLFYVNQKGEVTDFKYERIYER